MRIAIVTETFPPEINGVALTVQSFVEQLVAIGHEVLLTRPTQPGAVPVALPDGVREQRVWGAALPRYPGLRFGLPAGSALAEFWRTHRPDAAYIATEGPLGWSALNVANAFGIPAATGFHTRFDEFVAHYGAGFLAPLAFAWMRRFHNRGQAAWCRPVHCNGSSKTAGSVGCVTSREQSTPGCSIPHDAARHCAHSGVLHRTILR